MVKHLILKALKIIQRFSISLFPSKKGLKNQDASTPKTKTYVVIPRIMSSEGHLLSIGDELNIIKLIQISVNA